MNPSLADPSASRVVADGAGAGPAPGSHTTKLLFVFGGLERAGAQLRTLAVCRELNRRFAMKPDFCSLGLGTNELQTEIAELGGSTHLVSIRSPRFPVEFQKLLRVGGYDIVNTEPQLLSGLIVWLAARQRVPRRIVGIRNSIGDSGRLTASSPLVRRILSNRLFQWAMRALIKRYATNVIGVSRSALDTTFPPRWQRGSDCRVIYNGIELAPFQARPERSHVRDEFGWPSDSRIVVNVGRFTAQKNHKTILEAMRLVREVHPNVRLLLVGGGKLRDEIDRRVEALGLAEICHITGNRADVPRLLLASDVFFFPSAWEGLPGAALEALAAGLPVVASDIPPMQEVARFFPGAIFMAPADQASRHAENIRRALGMTMDRARALERFASSPFSLERAVDAYGSLYELDGWSQPIG